jgi:tetratricopeptide (TPR) repeat protein
MIRLSEARLLRPRLRAPLLMTALLLAGCGGPAAARPPAIASSPPVKDTQLATAALSRVSAPSWGSTDKVVAQFQAAIKDGHGSAQNYATLGAAYLQKWRDNGDPSWYAKAEPALDKARALEPDNFLALLETASLEASRHNFDSALAWAEKAIAAIPENSEGYGIKADALVELGRYPEAIQTEQKMIDLRPDLSSYSRVSYLRELLGDVPGAMQSMQMAIRAGGPTAESTNWCRYQLGMLYFNEGRLDDAERQFADALYFVPGYVHAQAGLGAVEAARGNYEGAIKYYAGAVETMPFPQYIIELGDVYTAAGQPDQAQRQYDLVRAMETLYQANGVNVDAELALFDADHGLNVPSLVEEGRQGIKERPSIIGHDVLAWTLYQAGQYEEAEAEETHAMSTGMKNALFHFHLGMIELKLGHPERGKHELQTALAINSYFSVRYAPIARQELAK